MTTTPLYTVGEKGRVRRTQAVPRRELPPAWPFFVLGLLMPIDTIGGIPPLAMDVARYGLSATVLLAVYMRRRQVPPSPLLEWASFFMVASGVLAVLKAAFLGGSLLGPLISLASPLVAFLLVRKRFHVRPLLLGFLTGCTWSALDIVLQANGLPYLGKESADGFRITGFSFNSTHVAPLLAVAICLVVTSWAWRRQHVLLRLLLLVVLGSGMLMSQGRVGLAGLLAALLVFALSWFPRRPGVVATVAVGLGVAAQMSGALAALLDYVMRSDAPVVADFSSGRSMLNEQAWEAFWASGPLGVDPQIQYLLNPHMAVLEAAVGVGPFGLFATGALCLMLGYIMLSRRAPVVFRMIAAIAFTTAFLEPSGFFVGFTGAVLVLVCFTIADDKSSGAVEHQGKELANSAEP